MHWRLLYDKSQSILFSFYPKELKKRGGTKSRGQNLHVTAENRHTVCI